MMDKRSLRSRKAKSRNVRPYDRQNQSIFGKVCSTVKGLFNPSSWFNVSHWITNSEEHAGSSDDVEEENENVNNDGDIVSQSLSNASKRLRLRFDGHNFSDGPSIQNSETQTWPEQPSQNLYEPVRMVSPPSATHTLLENKEVMAVMNGDDHSENSEGSASTSGCSSLVSSHKESNRLVERPFVSLLDMKSSRKRRNISPKSDYNDLNSSRNLWSTSFSPSLKLPRHYPTVSHTNQPNFNLSSFAGPSRLNESSEKNISSPFYEGKTTFGGASASQRIPTSVIPYQVDRSLRNQIRNREQNSDNLKRMSSAAERILLTLDKISSPVSDAKKIPNSGNSPVDLTVYLTPAKSRWNSQFTPPVASKGPPIANINTIAKIAALKNCGTSRLRRIPLDGAITSAEQKSSLDSLQTDTLEVKSQKSCGGKMKNKLNQHHISSKQGLAESEVMDAPLLKSIPLPITTLPSINFGTKPDTTVNSHLSASNFTFSKPIEHDLSVSNALPTSTLALHSPYDSFKFAHPIDYELPNNSQPKENLPCSTWECSACWVRNPQSRISCLSCETLRETKETKNLIPNTSAFESLGTNGNPVFKFGSKPLENAAATTASSSVSFKFAKSETVNQISSSETQNNHISFGSTTSTFTFNSPKGNSKEISSSVSESANINYRSPMCTAFGTRKENSSVEQKQIGLTSTASPFENNSKSCTSSLVTTSIADSSNTWECKECWVRNPSKESKCLACETPKSSKNIEKSTTASGENENSEAKSMANNEFSTWECASCWVRNPMKEKKCIACETLHPNIDLNSAVKDNSGFKFSSPILNSPIAFKFGNFISTVPSTITTSTFKFGVVSQSQTTTTNSSAKSDSSNLNTCNNPTISATVSKSPEILHTTTHSSVAIDFKKSDATLNSEMSQNENTSDKSGDSQTKSIFSVATKATESSISESKNSCATEKNEDTVIKTKELATESEKNNCLISNAVHSKESSKEKPPDAVISSSSSSIPSPSVTTCFGFTSKPIEMKDTKENKIPIFKFTSETPAVSAFSCPANLFKFGEKMNSPKSNLSNASATLPITTTTTSFSFSGGRINFGNVKNSVNNEVTSAASNSHSLTVKTEENKTVPSTTISSTTASIPFVFGSSVNTSASSGFSFFPTSSSSATTIAPTVTTSVFTFGASSNHSGGFTFKSLEKPTSIVSSASQTAPTGLNAGTSTQASSFQPPVFGTSKSETTSGITAPPVTFTFGTGSTTVSSNASAFSAFHPTQTGNPSFQFGSQNPGSTTSTTIPCTSTNFVFSKSEAPNSTSSSVSQNTVSAFGSNATNFVFGAKTEASNQISTVSQPSGLTFGSSPSFTFSNKNVNSDTTSQKPPLPFGSSAMPVFGNTSVQPSFDESERHTSGGFNFGSSSSVFQFGAGSNTTDKKRTATASGFSFGTPAASDTTANSFSTGFSMNTPPSFNFGAASTPAGPFQFAASSAAAKPTSAVNAGTRKIRKAVRRVRGTN